MRIIGKALLYILLFPVILMYAVFTAVLYVFSRKTYCDGCGRRTCLRCGRCRYCGF